MEMAILCIGTAVYTLLSVRAAIVVGRQQGREQGRGGITSGSPNFFIGVMWPLAVFLVGVAIVFFDSATVGFAPSQSDASRDTGD